MFVRVAELRPEYLIPYNNLIYIYYALNLVDKATVSFEKSVSIRPNGTAYSNYGTILFYRGLYADARDKYEEAIKYKPGDYRIWGNLADTYRYTLVSPEKSRSVYLRAMQLAKDKLNDDPENALLRSSVALYYAKTGDHENALNEISTARRDAPDYGPVLYKAVLVFEITGQRDRALEALEAYVETGGSMEEIRKDPDLDRLHKDPRYLQLVK